MGIEVLTSSKGNWALDISTACYQNPMAPWDPAPDILT
jgi:hypothetical protein